MHDYLSGRFGAERIFFDRETIEGGDDFPERLCQGVEGCAVLLALIGPDWLDATAEDGSRRLDDPGDFVRQEIALALDRSKRVIPVLFDDTPVPPADRLPDALKALATRDALTLRGKSFEYRTQRDELVRLLATVPGVPPPFAEAGEAIADRAAEQLPTLIEAATRGWQQTSEAQRETIRSLERQLGTNEAQLRAFFQIIGEAQVPPERQPARLIEIAAQYRQLQGQIAAAPGDDPAVARLKGEARAALETGHLERADDLLAQIEAAQDVALDRRQRELDQQQLERAATAAQRGGLARTRLRYREAAQHLAAAARWVPPGYAEQALAYLDQEANALYRQGEEFGDNAALLDTITRCRTLLQHRARERVPLDWAMTQNNLGSALQTLGERESGTARLEEAVQAYRDALDIFDTADVEYYRTIVQRNLDRTLSILGCKLRLLRPSHRPKRRRRARSPKVS